MNPYQSIAEDIEWLGREWLTANPESLTQGDIRRGSSTLRLLLTEGLMQKAWLRFGHQKQPTLIGPDIAGFASRQNLRVDLAPLVIAGGARLGTVEWAFLGIFRADNQETGVPADAESGFGVTVTWVTRDIRTQFVNSEAWLEPILYRKWYLSEYLESPGAIRKGVLIKRRDVIDYFRNYVGGAHHDLLNPSKGDSKRELFELAAEVAEHAEGPWDGLHFELLSIGQSVARSTDLIALTGEIRAEMKQ